MQAILKHELIPVPLSLAETMSHSMRTGNESSVAEFLTEKTKVPGVKHTSQGNAALFIDGLLLLENQKKQTVRDFSGYTWTLCYREDRCVIRSRGNERRSALQ